MRTKERSAGIFATAVAAQLLVASAAHGAPEAELLRQVEAAKPAVLARTEKLVSIDSPTGDAEGIGKVAATLRAELEAIGAEVRLVGNPPQLVAKLPGKGKKRFLLVAHTDTVFPAGTAAARPFRIVGNRAYGPGVADSKASVAIAVEAAKLLVTRGSTDFAALTLVFNSDEEIGSPVSKELIVAEARASDYTFSVQPGRVGDGIVIWRKGNGTLEIEVEGRAAHAGNEPEKGRNAAVELAHQVLAVTEAARRIPELRLNFTLLGAGERSNVIPARAHATADLRFLSQGVLNELERVTGEIVARPRIPETKVAFRIVVRKPPMESTAESLALARRLAAIYRDDLGLTLRLEGSAGGSDANFTAAAGAITADGLGPIGGETHSADEYLEIDSVVPRLYLILRAIRDLNGT